MSHERNIKEYLSSAEYTASALGRSLARGNVTRNDLRALVRAYYEFGSATSLLQNIAPTRDSALSAQVRRVEVELEEATHLFAAAVRLNDDED